MIRQSVDVGPPSQAPHQKAGIKIGAPDPVARVRHSPTTELIHDGAEPVAGRCEPILMTGSVRAPPSFNDPLGFEFPQPRHQNGA